MELNNTELHSLFVPYEIAKQLQSKGFKEKCLGWYCNDMNILYANLYNGSPIVNNKPPKPKQLDCYAPIHEQVINWFMNEHDLLISAYPTNSSKYMFGDWDCEIESVKGREFHSGSSNRCSAINLAITEALKLI